jgi:hypothetical protein
MKLDFLTYFRKKYSKFKFHKNLSSGSLIVPCGMTVGWTEGQTDK